MIINTSFNKTNILDSILYKINQTFKSFYNDTNSFMSNIIAQQIVNPALMNMMEIIKRLHGMIYSMCDFYNRSDKDYDTYRTYIHNASTYEFAINELIDFLRPVNILSKYTINNLKEVIFLINKLKEINLLNEKQYQMLHHDQDSVVV